MYKRIRIMDFSPAGGTRKAAGYLAEGAGAVAVIVNGNRAYEDCFAELGDCLEACGFRLEAAAALLAEKLSPIRDLRRENEQFLSE